MNQRAVHLPDDVLDEARQVALQEGTSLDTLIGVIVSDALRHRKELELMRQRATRGNPDAALAVLDNLPSLPTEEWDMPDVRPGSPSDMGRG
ncbi:hypothetical protein VQ042_07385 [Aurantimonas sp. A2-1-M11]|uniref:hypothetical protein n=1 Tax=Aurantimonas sp. A2-1-M11 TaxID=3113712 RepID=UPI002F95A13C